MHDTALHSLTECAYCGAPVLDAKAHELCFFEHVYTCCSDRCKKIWRRVLIAHHNLKESVADEWL